MKLTRRKLAASLLSATAVAAPQSQPAPAQSSDSDLQAARDRQRANAAALDHTPIPMATEPAFQFKA
jgi:hypothetical protein